MALAPVKSLLLIQDFVPFKAAFKYPFKALGSNVQVVHRQDLDFVGQWTQQLAFRQHNLKVVLENPRNYERRRKPV
jgi:hypothetical protein